MNIRLFNKAKTTKAITTFLFILIQSNFTFATEFSEDFQTTNVTTVASFNLEDNGITATLEGGTAFTIGNGMLYRSGTKSWMVEPQSTNSRGTHTGSATITFDVPMSRVSFFVRSDTTQVVSTATLIDTDGNIAENSPVTNIVSSGWTEVNFSIVTGVTPLQGVQIDVAGPGGMAALDDLGGSSVDDVGGGGTTTPPPTPAPTPPSSGGGGGSVGILLLMMSLFRRKQRDLSGKI